jgi:hypothetical protein
MLLPYFVRLDAEYIKKHLVVRSKELAELLA